MYSVAPDTVLCVAAPAELNATTVAAFRDWVRNTISPNHRLLDVDLRKTAFIDSSGLGALIALHKTMAAQGGAVRLFNPRQQVLQILELTRMHRLMEIIRL